MKCNSCGSEWNMSAKIQDKVTNCPFCGASLTEDEPFSGTFDDVPSCFKYIFSAYGKDIINSKSKFLSLVSDFMPSLDIEKRLISYALDAGVFPRFISLDESKIESERLSAIMVLTDRFLITSDYAEMAVNWIVASLFNGYVIPTVQTAITNNQPKKQGKAGPPPVAGAAKGVFIFPDGEYEGEVVDGKRHGWGVMTYSEPCYRNPCIYSYEGEWKDDKKHGFGTARLNNTTTYKGEWESDLRSGNGILHYTGKEDSVIYDGFWKNDNMHGQGVYYYYDSSCYTGEFSDGKFSGYGVMLYSGGNRYEGEWQNAKRHGLGALYGPDNALRYKGYWHYDKQDPHGKKLFHSFPYKHIALQNGQYYGEISHINQPHGHGVMSYYDGTEYIGQWKDGKRQGFGTMYFKNGDRYEGMWKDGEYNGYGVYYNKNGNRMEGKWFGTNIANSTCYKPNGNKYPGLFFSFKIPNPN